MKYYTGVGTRQVDPSNELYWLMVSIGKKLARLGYTLRSGAADGCDMAFEEGCNEVNGNKEIYIAWNGFNNRWPEEGNSVYVSEEQDDWAELIASEIHPAWDKCSQGAKKLHTRNVYQVLGQDLSTPSKFLVCYAPVDRYNIPKGGTRTAFVLAQKYNIPTFNLAIEKDLTRIEKWLKL